jgi:hypothetical protein
MTFQSPRIYTYKITFEEVPYYYYGVHKEKYFNQEYFGSPYTHKWCWELYTPKKQILEIFDYTDEGWIEAQEVEKRLIKPFYNMDKWCLNENCGGKFSLEMCRKNGKIGGDKVKKLGIGANSRNEKQRVESSKNAGIKCYELGVGVHARTKEQMSIDGRKGGRKIVELGVGIHSFNSEQKSQAGKKGGKIACKKIKELGLGIFGMTFEERVENSKRNYELGIGIASLTKEERQEIVAKTNSQRWECCETGYITTSGPLTSYQRARGIDTSKRTRVS